PLLAPLAGAYVSGVAVHGARLAVAHRCAHQQLRAGCHHLGAEAAARGRAGRAESPGRCEPAVLPGAVDVDRARALLHPRRTDEDDVADHGDRTAVADASFRTDR